ncbi:DUF6596 domain-containing protein [Pseudonocardia sp. H11422]|uniref:DUF6596 domain-containing protein n=1 Tax=Pseudonocardia sp. H11422 TaxID=2835866 RepID=UPI0027E29F6B|nr:DUF6596 domain-containing protein [Pseudonocardia sp. H11422]
MLLHDARRAARVDDADDLVALERQDRTRWDTAEITEGIGLLEVAVGPAAGLVRVDAPSGIRRAGRLPPAARDPGRSAAASTARARPRSPTARRWSWRAPTPSVATSPSGRPRPRRGPDPGPTVFVVVDMSIRARLVRRRGDHTRGNPPGKFTGKEDRHAARGTERGDLGGRRGCRRRAGQGDHRGTGPAP